MATYKKYATKNNTPIQVQSAIEDGAGKNIQNNYAKQDGYYNKLTSGYSENLTPYSSESGVTQNIPFNFQGTGCGNGTAQVDTGSYGIIKNKRGFGLNVNQLIGALTPTSINDLTVSFVDGVLTVSGTASANTNLKLVDASLFLNGHKLLIQNLPSGGSSSTYGGYFATSGDWVINTSIITYSNQGSFNIRIVSGQTVNISCKPILVDLTLMYGNNAWIPSDLLSHPENFYRYYQGSLAYNTGTLVHSNGRYLVTTGFNQLPDDINVSGTNVTYREVTLDDPLSLLGEKYCFSAVTNAPQPFIVLKDINNNTISEFFIRSTKNGRNYDTFTLNSSVKVAKIRFYYNGQLGTSGTFTYDKININLSYAGERDGEYEHYEELDNIDTGTEDLLQAGEASDTKAKDGTITHNLVEINLSEKTWTLVEGEGYWYFIGSSPSNIRSVGSANLPNAHSDKYVTVEMNNAGLANNTFAIDSQFILVRTSSTSVTPTGTIIAELDEPTTEQGTPYESTLNINDFGTMYWLTSDNATPSVPQGIEIFYPVDYKAFVDTLYNHTDGDANNVVVQSDLEAEDDKVDELYAIYKANMGGALRHQLASANSLDFSDTAWLDLGSLNWQLLPDNTTTFYIPYANLPEPKVKSGSKLVCPIYKDMQGATINDGSANMTISSVNSGTLGLRIHNTSYTNADTFKAAMKGILLAYEKA